MTSWINYFNHTQFSKNRVHRIMKKLGIHSVIRKKKKKYIYAKPDVTEFKVPGEKKKLYARRDIVIP